MHILDFFCIYTDINYILLPWKGICLYFNHRCIHMRILDKFDMLLTYKTCMWVHVYIMWSIAKPYTILPPPIKNWNLSSLGYGLGYDLLSLVQTEAWRAFSLGFLHTQKPFYHHMKKPDLVYWRMTPHGTDTSQTSWGSGDQPDSQSPVVYGHPRQLHPSCHQVTAVMS